MLKPLGDRIVIELTKVKDTTVSGIVLPDSAQDKPQQGKVVAVGTGRVLADGQRTELEVKEGDQILFSTYAGTEVKFEGNEYLILSENDILAIIG
ncbi:MULTISPECIES: co-chaperone GroES [unclassified Sporosarcina]|uniref:co-chaperone GroES n=1 Tax=unclassified Sporosarcina TaxID=2647733 RepID=UPI000C167145|nr:MULTISPECIES: co-chaperone GroES [unclassified Sporosarcina]PID05855.1 co-chaperone GroES [Sporosarcina sp. P30]PID09049.1 co-chaperone GroES [Sporosarcina sp. P31]PID12346.1 co-chaperone GroES [Sporosarcina sp. P32b]